MENINSKIEKIIINHLKRKIINSGFGYGADGYIDNVNGKWYEFSIIQKEDHSVIAINKIEKDHKIPEIEIFKIKTKQGRIKRNELFFDEEVAFELAKNAFKSFGVESEEAFFHLAKMISPNEIDIKYSDFLKLQYKI